MALDGLVIHSIADELNSLLNGAKIDKIYQPEEDEILLQIRNHKTNYKLVLSASASNPRVYLAEDYKKNNPKKAPVLCMLLRKYVQGGVITNIEQVGFERILKISVESFDELKEKTIKDIYVEIMGRHSNIILVQRNENRIVDAAKRIPVSVSRVRQILPGQDYNLPPAQDKLNPLDSISLDDFSSRIKSFEGPCFKSIYSEFLGISPSIAREICFRAGVEKSEPTSSLSDSDLKNLFNAFENLFKDIKEGNYSPCIILNEKIDKIVDFGCINMDMYHEFTTIHKDSISSAIEDYYKTKDIKDRINQRASVMKKNISIKLERLIHKLEKQQKELEESENAEIYKVKGELITSYIYIIEKGMESVDVQNFYDPEYKTVTIALKKNLTPSENAQKYFKKYNKLKNAKIEITNQMAMTKEEIEYLENTILGIENCENLKELKDIREELVKTGYVKSQKKIGKKEIQPSTAPLEFKSSEGYQILVGKNNRQNDYLTLRLADNDDIWMHTKDIPGSHVIVKCAGHEPSDQTLFEAAVLAAYYSKARMSAKVPVDYTKRKNVKKPGGAKPGMVIYETNNTAYVTPTEEIVAQLKIK